MQKETFLKSIAHVATRNQIVKSHSVLFNTENNEILLVVKLHSPNSALVFNGATFSEIELSNVAVGRMVALQELKTTNRFVTLRKDVTTDVNYAHYFALLTLVKQKMAFTGKSEQIYTTVHTKDVVSLNMESLIKHFPDKTGKELMDAFGVITMIDLNKNEYSIMILDKTIIVKREAILNATTKNVKYIYTLSEESFKVGKDMFDKLYSGYLNTIEVAKPTPVEEVANTEVAKTKKKPVK